MARRINFYDKLLFYGRGVLMATFNAATGAIQWAKSFQQKTGTAVSSPTATITVPTDGDVHSLSGTGAVDFITTTNYQTGAEIEFVFASTATLNHNTGSPPATAAAILLSGNANLKGEANMRIKLRYNGTNWVQSGAVIANSALGFRGPRFFKSAEQTGTGGAQNIAHGLGVTPQLVIFEWTDTAPATAGQATMTEGAHDATNVVITATTGKKYKVIAWG